MWQYARGCVIIHISGYRPDRLIERMRQSGVALNEVKRTDAHAITARIMANDFIKLRTLARRSRCRVRILEKRGLPFRMRRLWMRPALWGTLLACICAIVFLSTRILTIRIEGTYRVPQKLVLRALNENGVHIGSAKPKQDLISLATAVRAYDPRIAWVELSLDGVVMQIRIVESPRETVLVDPNAPYDILAVKDGEILSIETYEGTALVQAGDMVHAGDTLISGVVPLEGVEQPLVVHARGKVTARVAYFGEYAAAATQETMIDGSGRADYRSVRVLKRTLFKTADAFDAYEIRDVSVHTITDWLVPIELTQGVIVERVAGQKQLTRAEQTELALVEAERVAMLKVPKDARIVEKSSATRVQDGLIIGVVGVVTEETIGLEKEIVF